MLYTCTLGKSLVPSYQKYTDMFNWSPCRYGLQAAEPVGGVPKGGGTPGPGGGEGDGKLTRYLTLVL